MEDIFYEYNRDRDLNMHISMGNSNNSKLHFHRSLEILYLISGYMKCTVGDEEFIVGPDEIVFVHNYYVHAFFPFEEYKKVFLIVPSDYGNDLYKTLKKSTLPSRLDDVEFNRALLPLFKKLYSERESMSPLVKKGYLNVIVGALFEHYPAKEIKRLGNIDFIADVLQYIDEHYNEPITLDSLAAHFGYNKYYFSRLFSKYVRENIPNYINLVRLQNFMRAAAKCENIYIAKLASECGFESLTTFYRAFNKTYGVSPKVYFSK